MILVNGEAINFTQFPDGTTSFHFDTNIFSSYSIEWRYDGDHECILLWYLVKHIRSSWGSGALINLIMPYIPNARMDRVKRHDEVFTLKWFAEFINLLKFDLVTVLDPHSNVSAALINDVSVAEPDEYIRKAVSAVKKATDSDDLLLCYPDEGTAKRTLT